MWCVDELLKHTGGRRKVCVGIIHELRGLGEGADEVLVNMLRAVEKIRGVLMNNQDTREETREQRPV